MVNYNQTTTANPLDILKDWHDGDEAEFSRTPMPPAVYTSPEIHTLEIEKIFKKEWMCVGHTSELKVTGDYLTFDLAGHLVIVVRDRLNALRVYSNVCPHRSSRLLDGAGNCGIIVCPYHAWAFNLDGKLRGAPRMKRESTKHVCLHELKLEVWQGLIFVNLDQNAEPLSERLTGLEGHIGQFNLPDMTVVHSYDGDVECNWKVLVENFCESYHLFRVHKNTLEPDTPTAGVTVMPAGAGFNHHTLQRTVVGLEKRNESENLEHLSGIYPCMTFAVSTYRALWLSIMPVGYNRLRFRAWVAKDLTNTSGLSKEELDLVLAFMQEDKVINVGVQKGLEAGVGNRGPLNELEQTNLDFGRYYAELMLQ